MHADLKESDFRELLLWLLRLRWRFRVTGVSMIPLLKPGDEVLVDPGAYRKTPPYPGHIILMRHPYRAGTRLVKRVTQVLEEGRCLVRGDNPSESTDSRSFGTVSPAQIMGRVTSRFR